MPADEVEVNSLGSFLPARGLAESLVLVRVFCGHGEAVSAALAAVPVCAFRADGCRPALRALVVAEGLFEAAMSTKHTVSPLMDMINSFIMAITTRECAPAAWEAHPPVAFLVMPAGAIAGERLTNFDAQLPLVLPSLLELFPCIHALALISGGLAPLGNSAPQQVNSFYHEVVLGEATSATRPLAVARSYVVHSRIHRARPTACHEVAPKQLDGMAAYTHDMRHSAADMVAYGRGHSEPELLLADRAGHLRALQLSALA